MDQNGCIVVVFIEVMKINEFEVVFIVENVFCNGGSDGQVIVVVFGGFGNYGQYIWNIGVNIVVFENIFVGGYSFMVVDVLGCQVFVNIVVQ